MPFGRNFGSFRYFTCADPAMSKLKVPLIHQNENSFSRTTLALAERTFYGSRSVIFRPCIRVVIVLFIPIKHMLDQILSPIALHRAARELTIKKVNRQL